MLQDMLKDMLKDLKMNCLFMKPLLIYQYS